MMNLMHWLLIYCSKKKRICILHKKSLKSVPQKVIRDASCEAKLGHFFVLKQISENTNPETFIKLISELANKNKNANELI